MGSGSYSFAAYSCLANEREYSTKSADAVFKNRSLSAKSDIKLSNINARTYNTQIKPEMVDTGVRESRDSNEHPETTPIIIALDVTGSMRRTPHEMIKDNFPKLMDALMQLGVKDPQLLFMAVGDHEYDRYPIQVGQFESDTEKIVNSLEEFVLEGGGGGNAGESYLLAHIIAGYHTETDSWFKRHKKGYLFTIGEKELRAKAQIVADANSPSGYKRQETSPFSQYGITCGLVSILDIKYDGATQSQIDAQKQANLAVITSKTKSLEAIQRTVQITEEGRAAAERAKWEQEKEKAVAVTKAQQEFEVAELEAKKAKQVALKVQAEGEAKAAANRALVSAGLTPAERAEWDYKTAVGVAQALAESKVSWVPSVMFGGGSSSNSAMDAVGLKMLLDITKSLEKTSK